MFEPETEQELGMQIMRRGGKDFRIYLSFDPADRNAAEEVERRLVDHFQDVLCERKKYDRPEDRNVRLWSIKTIRKCDVFVLIISRTSLSPVGWIKYHNLLEYTEALNFYKKIIFLFLGDEEMFSPELIQKLSRVPRSRNFVFSDKGKRTINIAGLFEALQELGGRIKTHDSQFYDVFLCYKSQDQEYAYQVYNLLISKGLKVFYSRETLPKLGSAEYHKQIDEAVEISSHMVVVASSRRNIESKWVDYEWRLFLGEILQGRRKGNLITVLAGNLTLDDLPISLRHREAIPLFPEEIERLLSYVPSDHLPGTEGSKEGENFGTEKRLFDGQKGEEEKRAGADRYSEGKESETYDSLVSFSEFEVAGRELVKHTSWHEANKYAFDLSKSTGQEWRLPSMKELAEIRMAKPPVFPDHHCYWSGEESGSREAYYLHFDDGHKGAGPKDFNKGLCAVFVKSVKPEFSISYGKGRVFRVCAGDLLSAKTDAIVNPTNSGLSFGGGLAGEIAKEAGPEFEEECERVLKRLGRVPLTMAVPTKAGNLPYKGVIHAVGPSMGDGDEKAKLEKTITHALIVAERKGWKSVAFPAISTGIKGVPDEVCAGAFKLAVPSFWSNEEYWHMEQNWLFLAKDSFPVFKKILSG